MAGRLPVLPGDFSAAYIERLFGARAGSLTALAHMPVGTGQVCDSFRFRCDWHADAQTGRKREDDEPLPSSFIAKCPSTDAASRGAAALFHLYEMEIGWYRDFAGHAGVTCPRCYHAEIAADGQDFVLLLEDMAPAVQGDQLAGATLLQVATTLQEAAALHALPAPDGDWQGYSWLHYSAGNSDFLKQTLPPGYAAFRDRFAALLSSDILDLGQELVNRIAAYIDKEPAQICVTHGDMRLDNILFGADGRLAALVDWQTCSLGNPANDVAYMIGTSFADPKQRRDHEENLVAAYLSDRAEISGRAADIDRFWTEYRRCAFAGFLMAINASLHVEQTERGDAMFAAMAARPAQMALDLDSLSLI